MQHPSTAAAGEAGEDRSFRQTSPAARATRDDISSGGERGPVNKTIGARSHT
jgi:hypothetical protein